MDEASDNAALAELMAGWPTPEVVQVEDLRLCAICYVYHPRAQHDEHMQSHGYTTLKLTRRSDV